MNDERILKRQNILVEMKKDSQRLDEESFYHKYENKVQLMYRFPNKCQDLYFFRSRLADNIGKDEDLSDLSTFSYIPKEKLSHNFPKIGRMNRTGQSMFYASLTPETNLYEISDTVKVGDTVYFSQWRIKKGFSLSVYPICTAENIKADANVEEYLALASKCFAEGDSGDYLRYLSDLLTMTGDDSCKYLCSSVIANDIFNQNGRVLIGNQEIPYSYDAIVYPSMKIGKGELRFLNIAIMPSVVDEKLEMNYVAKGTVGENMCSIEIEELGLYIDCGIVWFDLQKARFQNFKMKTQRTLYRLSECICKDADDKNVSEASLERTFRNHMFEMCIIPRIESGDSKNNEKAIIMRFSVMDWFVYVSSKKEKVDYVEFSLCFS